MDWWFHVLGKGELLVAGFFLGMVCLEWVLGLAWDGLTLQAILALVLVVRGWVHARP